MKEYVGWLQIKVDNFVILFLEILDSTQYLSYDVLCLSLVQAAHSFEICPQLRTRTILHHKSISIISIELVQHLHDVGVRQLPMYFDLFD